eukprot:39548_1
MVCSVTPKMTQIPRSITPNRPIPNSNASQRASLGTRNINHSRQELPTRRIPISQSLPVPVLRANTGHPRDPVMCPPSPVRRPSHSSIEPPIMSLPPSPPVFTQTELVAKGAISMSDSYYPKSCPSNWNGLAEMSRSLKHHRTLSPLLEKPEDDLVEDMDNLDIAAPMSSSVTVLSFMASESVGSNEGIATGRSSRQQPPEDMQDLDVSVKSEDSAKDDTLFSFSEDIRHRSPSGSIEQEIFQMEDS